VFSILNRNQGKWRADCLSNKAIDMKKEKKKGWQQYYQPSQRILHLQPGPYTAKDIKGTIEDTDRSAYFFIEPVRTTTE